MVKTKNTVKKVKKSENDTYFATINVLGKNYESKGGSVLEAVSGLKPDNCKGRGIITILHGDVKKEKIIMPMAVFRLFNTQGLSREIALKNICNLFQGL